MSLLGLGTAISAPPHRRVEPPGEPEPEEPDLRLTWAPPDTSGYTVQDVPAGPALHTQYNLTAGVDYLITMPNQLRVGNVTFNGGRNVVVIGGEIEVHPNADTDQRKRCFYFLNQSGDIHIEGIHFHRNDANVDFDVLYFRTDDSLMGNITLQNCLFTGVDGTFEGWHADGFQIQTSSTYTGNIRIDKWTGYGNYQQYYVQSRGNGETATIKRSNWIVTGEAGVMLWFGDNGTGDFARKYVTLGEGCYLQTYQGASMNTEVRPNSAATLTSERPVISDGVMTWPNSDYIIGELRAGTPPDGDWVTSEIAGYGYVSPGYLEG